MPVIEWSILVYTDTRYVIQAAAKCITLGLVPQLKSVSATVDKALMMIINETLSVKVIMMKITKITVVFLCLP